MNILYISHLSGSKYAGPTYSVPKQIDAQSKLDNVFWYNAVKNSNDEWKKLTYYADLTMYPNESLKGLPLPFDEPDIIVVEQFYNMFKSPLIKELLKSNIPYVIIPRGELTKQAQKRKKIKKCLANFLKMKKFAKRAALIQYLTLQEFNDSGKKWNNNPLIIPNGISIPQKQISFKKKKRIDAVFIGRIEPYQKGLDLLIDACKEIKSELHKSNFKLLILGPDNENKIEELKKIVKINQLDKIIEFGEGVYGKEKEKLLLNSDVFILTSRFEGHPMALIEALSYGIPSLVTLGSNMKKEIEECDAGWTADNSSYDISIALLNMLNCNNYEEKSKNAIELAKKYTWTSIAQKTHDEFKKIIGIEDVE